MAASFPDFRWTLTKVTQTGVSIDLDVLYTESTTGFSQHQNVHIQDGSTATTASVVTAIVAQGTPLKAALVAEVTLSLFIGNPAATNVVL